MTDHDPHDRPGGPDAPPRERERLAKRIARSGVASRRVAERLIEEGRVRVNGRVAPSPAFDVGPHDRIEVDEREIAAPEPPRVWRYHKPAGLVTTEADEHGRPTVFDRLPEDMPRVLSIGRLDLNSEGLLLLTNDGGLKRRLELPSTGWLRRYRVRVHGRPTDADLAPLTEGMVVDGEHFRPMSVGFDRQQGANAWLTIALREGRNRELRRALGELGFEVNRLIRISYGPFQLGDLTPGEVDEVRPRVLRDQLGLAEPAPEPEPDPRAGRGRPPRRAPGPASKAGAGGPARPGRGAAPAAETGRQARPAPGGGRRAERGAEAPGQAGRGKPRPDRAEGRPGDAPRGRAAGPAPRRGEAPAAPASPAAPEGGAKRPGARKGWAKAGPAGPALRPRGGGPKSGGPKKGPPTRGGGGTRRG